MGSVTIEQWRGRIGSFSGGLVSFKLKRSNNSRSFNFSITGQVLGILSTLLVYSTINLSLLLQSGVERNPGPFQGKIHFNALSTLERSED